MNPFPSSSPASRLFTEIVREAGPLGLASGAPRPSPAADRLAVSTDVEVLGARPADPLLATLVRAGLYLLADRNEAAHEVCQKVETPEGSWWHGIVHRREPDFDNARYWFRRVGFHPLMEELARDAPGSGKAFDRVCPGRSRWDSFAFIDICEEGGEGSPGDRKILLDLQDHEIANLLAFCHEGALGRGERPR
jgi:hypothetical protein